MLNPKKSKNLGCTAHEHKLATFTKSTYLGGIEIERTYQLIFQDSEDNRSLRVCYRELPGRERFDSRSGFLDIKEIGVGCEKNEEKYTLHKNTAGISTSHF